MKKAVIFDLDGLLIDSETIAYKIDSELVGKYGHEFPLAEYIAHYSGKTVKDNAGRLVEVYGLPYTPDEALKWIIARDNEYIGQGVPLKKGARELLEFLKSKGIKVLLATSSVRERAVDILSQNGIDGFFDDMLFGDEVKNGKPAPDIYLKAMERTGVPAEECLVLEDSEAGIRSAHSAGVDVICIPDMKAPAEEYRAMAYRVIPSLDRVIGILEENETEMVLCGEDDIAEVSALYGRVVDYLECHVNYPRWSHDYPNEISVGNAVRCGTQYACVKGGKVIGAVVLNGDPQGDYSCVCWKNKLMPGEFLVIHALAVDYEESGSGVGSFIVDFCLQTARRRGYKAVRLDVVPDNEPAIGLYTKKGFAYAGTEDMKRGIPEVPLWRLYEYNFADTDG